MGKKQSEFDKVLGTEGSLVIKDQNGNTVKEVRNTDFDENGKLISRLDYTNYAVTRMLKKD